MNNILFDIEQYEADGKIIEADNIIPIERYIIQQDKEKRRKAELLRAGISQKVSGLLLSTLAFFVSIIAGGLDCATGCFLILGVWLIISKQRFFY